MLVMYACGVDIHARQYDTVPILTIVVTDSVLTPQGTGHTLHSFSTPPHKQPWCELSASVGPAVCKAFQPGS